MKYTYPNLYQCAIGQKLSFHDFVLEWLEKHDIDGAYQQEQIIRAMYLCGWDFFQEELFEYFDSNSDIYQVNEDCSVTVFEE